MIKVIAGIVFALCIVVAIGEVFAPTPRFDTHHAVIVMFLAFLSLGALNS